MSTSSGAGTLPVVAKPLDSKASDKEIKAQVGVQGPILLLLGRSPAAPEQRVGQQSRCQSDRPTGAQGPTLVYHPSFAPRATAEWPRITRAIDQSRKCPQGHLITKGIKVPSSCKYQALSLWVWSPGEKLPEESRPPPHPFPQLRSAFI